MNIFTLMGNVLIDNQEALKQMDKTNEAGQNMASKFSVATVAMGTAIGNFATKAGEKLLEVAVDGAKLASELDASLNSLQASTGATDEEMQELHDTMLDIYGQNYGENFEDIGEALKEVKQQTGLTGEALKETTINAMALKDVYGFEYQESIRTVDMLMKQFNITSEEAYNLIAQGAQAGLDKNGNLLDTINEYSVHFKQLGFTEEEFFNILSNGAEQGVFDIDKLGDAVKEFGIRVKDGSADEAFEKLGLNTEKLKTDFNEGGEAAKQATQQVIEALINCDDKVLQNQLGVKMFGTMWEDLGSEAILALSNTNGEFDKTKATMESIKEIKYDDFGSAITGIGKQLQAGLVIPLEEKVLPYLNEFANWLAEKLPSVIESCQPYIDMFGNAISSVAEFIVMLKDKVTGAFDGLDSETEKINEFSNTVVDNLSSTFDTIADIVTSIASWFSDFWSEYGDSLIESVGQIFTEITDTVSDILNILAEIIKTLLDVIVEFWNTWGETITAYVTTCWNGLKNIIKVALDVILDVLNIFKDVFKGDWSKLWEDVKKLLSDAFNLIGTIMQASWNNMLTICRGFIEKFKQAGRDIVNGIVNGIKEKINTVVSTAKEIGNTVLTTVKGVLDIHSPSRAMKALGGYTVEGFVNGINENKKEVSKSAKAIADAVKDECSEIGKQLKYMSQDELAVTEDTLLKVRDKYKGNADAVASINNTLNNVLSQYLKERLENTDNYTQQDYHLLRSELQDKQQLYKDNKKFAEEVEEAITKINEEEYKKQVDALKDAVDDMKSKRKELYDDEIDSIDKYKDAQLQALDDQLKAIENAEKEKADLEKQARLEKAVAEAESIEDKKKAQEDLDEWLHDKEIARQKEAIKLQQESIKEQVALAKENAKNKYDEEIKAQEQFKLFQEEFLNLQKQYKNKTDEELIKMTEASLAKKEQAERENLERIKKLYEEQYPQYKEIGKQIQDNINQGKIESVEVGNNVGLSLGENIKTGIENSNVVGYVTNVTDTCNALIKGIDFGSLGVDSFIELMNNGNITVETKEHNELLIETLTQELSDIKEMLREQTEETKEVPNNMIKKLDERNN